MPLPAKFSFVLIYLPLLAVGMLNAPLLGAVYGLGIEGASLATKTAAASEIPKKGYGFAGYLGIGWMPSPTSYATAALGGQWRQVTGETAQRRQAVLAKGLILDLDYRWDFGGIEVGPMLRWARGKAATLKAGDKETVGTTLALGPKVAYRFQFNELATLGYIGLTRDLNVAEQINTNILLGLQVWLPNAKPADSTPAPEPKPTPPPAPAPQPEPVPAPVPASE